LVPHQPQTIVTPTSGADKDKTPQINIKMNKYNFVEKQIFAAMCFANYCKHFNINHSCINELVLWQYWLVALVILITHTLIDCWKSFKKNTVVYFITDQICIF